MSPSIAIRIMRYAANNGTQAAREKFGAMMYNNALGASKASNATGKMIRKSLQTLAEKSDEAAKKIPKPVRDMMLPRGTKDLPEKPGSQIPKQVRDRMISKEQDAQNKGDAKLKTTNKQTVSKSIADQVSKAGKVIKAKSTEDQVSKAGKVIKTATDKGNSAAGKAGSALRGVAKVGGAVASLLASDKVGEGSDKIPAGRRDEFVKKKDAERKQQEADAEYVKKRLAEHKAKQQKQEAKKEKPKAEDKKPAPKKSSTKYHDVSPAEAAAVKKKMTDAQVDKRREELRAHNKRITAMTPAERKAYRESEAGKKGVLLKNQGGVIKANCGASMKPTQKSSRGN